MERVFGDQPMREIAAVTPIRATIRRHEHFDRSSGVYLRSLRQGGSTEPE
jgi:hypothetical protein